MSSPGRGGARVEADRYYTPTRLAEAIVERIGVEPGTIALEPSAGAGAFVVALTHRKADVYAVDMDPGAEAFGRLGRSRKSVQQFEAPLPGEWPRPSLILGNPPFSCAEAHVRRALDVVAPGGRVVFLLRLAFLEGRVRANLWRDHTPSEVIVLVERPSFTGQGTDSCAYGVFVWMSEARKRAPTLSWLSWRSK